MELLECHVELPLNFDELPDTFVYLTTCVTGCLAGCIVSVALSFLCGCCW